MLLGGVIPVQVMPNWLQTVAQFAPSTHLATGIQDILLAMEDSATIFLRRVPSR